MATEERLAESDEIAAADLGDINRQIASLPDGTKVNLVIGATTTLIRTQLARNITHASDVILLPSANPRRLQPKTVE